MFTYTAHGLTIQSELRLPELLLASEKAPDVSIHYGDVPDFLSETSYRHRTWEAI